MEDPIPYTSYPKPLQHEALAKRKFFNITIG